jgi:hypothetical protein
MQLLLTGGRWLLGLTLATAALAASAASVEQLAAETAQLQQQVQLQARAIADAGRAPGPRVPGPWTAGLVLLLAAGAVAWGLARHGRPRTTASSQPTDWPEWPEAPLAAPAAPAAVQAASPAPPDVARPHHLASPQLLLEELQALLEQHDLLCSIGHHAHAAQLLQQATEGELGDSAVPWLALLALQRLQGDADGCAATWRQLLARLGPVRTDALDALAGPGAALEGQPAVLQGVQAAWRAGDAVPALHAALFGSLAARQLTLAAAHELLWLAQVQHVLRAGPSEALPDDSWWRLLDSTEMPTRPGFGVDVDLGAWEAQAVAARTVRQAATATLAAVAPAGTGAAMASAAPPEPVEDAFDAVMRFERSRPAPAGLGQG